MRGLALALPGVVEQDHHGRPSFRVAGRIFATLWDQEHLNVMLGEAGSRTVVQAWPGACEEFWWGKRLGAAHVDLALADELLVGELLADAWEQKAPRRLLEDRIADATEPRTALSARCLALARAFRLGHDDLRAWERRRLPERAFDDWLTDRVARRPAGRRARDTYGAEDVHDFARRAILGALQLRAGDRLLDVGCGGGPLLRDALATGASATGVDHSEHADRLAAMRDADGSSRPDEQREIRGHDALRSSWAALSILAAQPTFGMPMAAVLYGVSSSSSTVPATAGCGLRSSPERPP